MELPRLCSAGVVQQGTAGRSEALHLRHQAQYMQLHNAAQRSEALHLRHLSEEAEEAVEAVAVA